MINRPLAIPRTELERINLLASLPFIAVHLAPLGALFCDVRPRDLVLGAALYFLRMFCITAGYHRYFAHRAFRAGRLVQFLLAWGGASAAQKGPLWWAGHHRQHHRYSDTPEDLHSPLKGFWWSHVGWIVCDRYRDTPTDLIRDFDRYPELRWLDRHYLLPPVILGAACLLGGGWGALWVGFFGSTVLLYHGTFFVNSLSHVFGRRRYATRDTSRNSMFIALITGGEGWHNNHHHCDHTANQGFYWWELDCTYYGLRLLAFLGLVSDLRTPTHAQRQQGHIRDGHFDVGMFDAYGRRARARLTYAQQQLLRYAEEKRSALRAYLDAARTRARDLMATPPARQGSDYQAWRNRLETFVATTRAGAEEYFDGLRAQTQAFCDAQRLRQTADVYGVARREASVETSAGGAAPPRFSGGASEACDRRSDPAPRRGTEPRPTIDELLGALRGAAEELRADLQRHAQELALLLADLEGRALTA